QDRLEQAVASARRNRQRLAVLFLDLDGFKLVNDTLGHLTGDALLRLAAQRIGSCLRKSDTGARLGGDEFAILVTNLGDDEDALRIAEKVLGLLREPLAIKGAAGQAITASIGIARFPNDAGDAEQLLKRADAAMYQAKQAGRDRVACWRPNARGGAQARRASERKSDV